VNKIKIAIVGSRNFNNKEKVFDKLDDIYDEFTGPRLGYDAHIDYFITGGAPGVDTWLYEWNNSGRKHPTTIITIRPVDSAKFSYLLRNVEIIAKSDIVYAFWDGESKGTKFVINYALKRKKEIKVILQ